MKKAILISGLFLALIACNEGSNNSNTGNDTLGDNPSATEGDTKHPGGVVNQNIISTDSSAMNVEKMSDTTGGNQ